MGKNLRCYGSITDGINFICMFSNCNIRGYWGYFDDSVITTKVKTALIGEKNLNSTQISVETFKGKVQLSGFVSSQADANRAIETTRKVTGVKGVINSMVIR